MDIRPQLTSNSYPASSRLQVPPQISSGGEERHAAVPEHLRNALHMRLPLTSLNKVKVHMDTWGGQSLDELQNKFNELKANLERQIESADRIGIFSVELGMMTVDLKMQDGDIRKADGLDAVRLLSTLEEYQAAGKLLAEKSKDHDVTDGVATTTIATTPHTTSTQSYFVATASLFGGNAFAHNTPPISLGHTLPDNHGQYAVNVACLNTLARNIQNNADYTLNKTTARETMPVRRLKELSTLGMILSPMNAGMGNYLRAIFSQIRPDTREPVVTIPGKDKTYEVNAYQVTVPGHPVETVWITTPQGSLDPTDIRVPGSRSTSDLDTLKREMTESAHKSMGRKNIRNNSRQQQVRTTSYPLSATNTLTSRTTSIAPVLLGGLQKHDVTALVSKITTTATTAKQTNSYSKIRLNSLLDLGRRLGANVTGNAAIDLRASLNAILQTADANTEREVVVEKLRSGFTIWAYVVPLSNQAGNAEVWILRQAGYLRPVDICPRDSNNTESTLKRNMRNAASRAAPP